MVNVCGVQCVMVQVPAVFKRLKLQIPGTSRSLSIAPKSTATSSSSSRASKGECLWPFRLQTGSLEVQTKLCHTNVQSLSLQAFLFSIYEYNPFSCLFCVIYNRDMFHGIRALDPDRLNVFRTVREITGERQSPSITSQPIKPVQPYVKPLTFFISSYINFLSFVLGNILCHKSLSLCRTQYLFVHKASKE